MTINAGPNLSLPNSEKKTEVSGYLETEFNLKWKEFHYGPLLGALIAADVKPFLGVHVGYEF